VLETDSEGKLWLKEELNVGTTDTSTVKIGYLNETKIQNVGGVVSDTGIHEVIRAGDTGSEFIVYEDGSLKATNGEFTGTVYANAGSIGDFTVGDINNAIGNMDSLAGATRKLDISSNLGYNFKVEGETITPSSIPLKATPVVVKIDKSTVIWEGSSDFESWTKLTTGVFEYNLSYSTFKAG
jgi:hypothetical protein